MRRSTLSSIANGVGGPGTPRATHRARGETGVAYVERVNLAIDHIVTNLDKPIRLKEVARVARFSPFHFHRVFQAIVGETPGDFAKRLRLERAFRMMTATKAPSLTRIAMACGFVSSSDFSRSFKQRFGVAPSGFDVRAWMASHRAELEALVGRDPISTDLLRIPRLPGVENPGGFRVRVRDLSARTVAYIRVLNPYRGGGVVGASQRLETWAERRGQSHTQWLGFQWDNPEIVKLERCQYHVGVVAERVEPRGEVGRIRFPEMVVAEVEVRGTIETELKALQWLYGVWLPRSGYVADDHPTFEAWIGRPFSHGKEWFELNVQMPIRRE